MQKTRTWPIAKIICRGFEGHQALVSSLYNLYALHVIDFRSPTMCAIHIVLQSLWQTVLWVVVHMWIALTMRGCLCH